MGSQIHKKQRMNAREDRISRLSDGLIHQILSYLDARFAVQTSILSKRWKFIWTTLPFLRFDESIHTEDFHKFINRVFVHRNYESNILQLKLQVKYIGVRSSYLKTYVEYAIDHNLQDLHVEKFGWDVPIYKSNSLKKLGLAIDFYSGLMPSFDSWYLPALTSLHLQHLTSYHPTLPESALCYFPALTNLRLDGFDLPASLSLPCLTTLHLISCELPETVWDLPALTSLELDNVDIGPNISEFFPALVSLQNLKLLFCFKDTEDCLICSPQLSYLELRTTNSEDNTRTPQIFILAPKLLNVNIVGIFSVTCGDSKLENVYIKLHGCLEEKNAIPRGMLKQYYCRLFSMFTGLGSAKFLTLDWDTIEALSAVVTLLERSSSPFYNLKYVKLPLGCKESSISSTVKSYLLGGSPGATIVTTLRQNDVIPQTVVGKAGQVGALVQGFGGLVPNAPRAHSYWTSNSKGNNDFGLWQGHEVNMEFVGLLDLIMKKHPETFEHFTSKNEKFCTLKLNMLCHSVKAFTTTAMSQMDPETIIEYRALFADLQRSFNVEWLVSHLNHKSYLLGGSPGATIVTTLRQNDVIPQTVVGKAGQVGALVQGFGGLVPNAPRAHSYWTSNSKGNNDFGLWQGHEVNMEFVDLLDLIMKKHPETFEHFTSKNEKFCTLKLNMLCHSVKAFTTTAMSQMDPETIIEYRALFADLQRSFNVEWLVSHLNHIEQFLF